MKKLTKNFIAFTLSEMMIVLLILSVISAATIPSITQRNEVKPRKTSSNWIFDYYYNKGYFYYSNDYANISDVIIGYKDIARNINSSTTKTTLVNAGKNASLRLVRPVYTMDKVYAGRTFEGRSSIAFFNSDGIYQGSIGNDSNRNIAIGKDIFKNTSVSSASNGVYIGGEVAKNLHNVTDGAGGIKTVDNNVVIGYRAVSINPSIANSYSSLQSENVVIGSNIYGSPLASGNIILGAYAATTNYFSGVGSYATSHNDTIAIGTYSLYESQYSDSSINVGYLSGSNATGTRFNNSINIGYYSGYVTRHDSGYSAINVGWEAGSEVSSMYGYSINIGKCASYNSSRLAGINIGAYANYNNSLSSSTSYFAPIINIGAYAGAYPKDYSIDKNTINIGAYAGYASYGNGDINIGYYAGYNYTKKPFDQDLNIKIGRFAGASAGSSTQDIRFAVMIGDYAGYGLKNSYNSVLIGRYAGYNFVSPGGSVIIGCYGLTEIKNARKMCIGGNYPGDKGGFAKEGNTVSTMITPYYSSAMWNKTEIFLLAKHVVNYQGSMSAFSDRTLKENIVKSRYGIDKLRKINIYQYNFKGEKDTKIGVIAQELQSVYPKAVSTASNGYLSVNSDWIIYSMVQALKDVDKAVIGLQNELNINIRYINNLSDKLCSINNKLDKLSQNNQINNKRLAEIDVILNKMERK